jgi:hypothetical protein
VIVLVAVVLLFVVGAMAALSIDIVTLYTARSEAQLAADAGALAGARVFANSGVTSDAGRRSTRNARNLATMIATQVAAQNIVGGRTLNPVAGAGEIKVSFDQTDTAFDTNPHVTVQTQRTDLPTFFARIWGRTANTVTASATAEAYNPSGANASNSGPAIPVAPSCVKPWLLPNVDPTQASASGPTIFSSSTGAITASTLVGKYWPNGPVATPNTNGIYSLCNAGDCSVGKGGITPPLPGAYYPGDPASFSPTAAAPASCSGSFNSYQLSIAGCVQTPISCGTNPNNINIDINPYVAVNGSRDADTVAAASCLIHYVNGPGDSDSVDTATTQPPLQFVAGNQNPVVTAATNIMVSDSLVTIPVINTTPGFDPTNPVQIIGFLQVFLNPSASSTMPYAPAGTASPYEMSAMIINMAGCGTSAAGQPIFGNGASPVAVRLITPP